MARRRIALFESWRGLYTDSPRTVSEELTKARPDIDQVWVAEAGTVLPEGVRRVRRHSPEYFALLGANDLLVANDIITKHLVKGPRSTYLQTWHGTPLKLIGHDEYLHGYAGAGAHLKRVVRDVATWTYLVSPSPVCTEIFRSAFRYDGPVLELGYPRNDALRSRQAEALRQRTRAALGLVPEDLAVLHMPTWRDDVRDASGALTMPGLIDPTVLSAHAPAGTVLLSRLHRNITVRQPDPGSAGGLRVLDCSRHPEVNELYLAADVLVSDYSSAIFDFAVTGKPILLLAPDLQRYAESVRGFYFDYPQWAPGPILGSSEELGAALGRISGIQADYSGRYAAFVETFCPFDDGSAGSRVVAALAERLH